MSDELNTLNEKLIQACIDEDVQAVESLLAQGANPNFLTLRDRSDWDDDIFPRYYQSPLDLLASYRSDYNHEKAVKIAKLLLQYGADVNGRTEFTTPLHGAIGSEGIYPLVKVLLENGADVHKQIDFGYNVLHLACGGFGSFAEPEIVDLLVEYGVTSDLNVQSDKDKSTPLHIAVSYNEGAYPKKERLTIIQKLVSLGADLTIFNSENKTVLMLAQNRIDLKKAIIKGLIEGAINNTIDNETAQQIINKLPQYDLRDLNELMQDDHEIARIDIINEIIENYLLAVYPDHVLEYKLHQACSSNGFDMGYDIDVSKIKELLEQGADPNFSDFSLFTKENQIPALNVLAKCVCRPMDITYTATQLLLEYGANPNSVDSNGNTALHKYAASQGGDYCAAYGVNLLAEYAADINIQNANGDTAAHLLFNDLSRPYHFRGEYQSLLQAFYELAKLGADFTITNNQGKSVLELGQDYEALMDIINPQPALPAPEPIVAIIETTSDHEINNILDNIDSDVVQSIQQTQSVPLSLNDVISDNNIIGLEDNHAETPSVPDINHAVTTAEVICAPTPTSSWLSTYMPNFISQWFVTPQPEVNC